jgi:hypothetical protein
MSLINFRYFLIFDVLNTTSSLYMSDDKVIKQLPQQGGAIE